MGVVQFKSGKVVFHNKAVWFDPVCCSACPGHHSGNPTPCGSIPAQDSGEPSCVRLTASDFPCPTAGTNCGGNDPFDGLLLFNGSDAWTTPGYTDPIEYCTRTFRQVRVTLTYDGTACNFTLTVSSGLTLVWQGVKDIGDSPCGIYYRTDGCDTRDSLTIG